MAGKQRKQWDNWKQIGDITAAMVADWQRELADAIGTAPAVLTPEEQRERDRLARQIKRRFWKDGRQRSPEAAGRPVSTVGSVRPCRCERKAGVACCGQMTTPADARCGAR